MSTDPSTLEVRVNLGPRSYAIRVVSADLAGVGPFARQRTAGSTGFVITDQHVASHAQAVESALKQAGFTTRTALVAPGEPSKSLATAADLYDRLADVLAD